VNGVIKKYGESVQTREGNLLAQYLTDNMGLLANRPRTFTHGDHNTLNIILSPDGRIGFIDFGQICRDPWWDFWELPSDVETQAHYYSGEFIGYFGGQPPLEFFKLLAFYVAVNALEQLAAHEGEDVPNHVKCVLNWFDDMRNPVPSWFLPFNQ
jgi:serine/threonine-protein kinase